MSRTIASTYASSVLLTQPGNNPLSITSTGRIDGTGSYALAGTSGVAWTIVNSGTVDDIKPQFSTLSEIAGISLASGGSVANQAGALVSAYDAVNDPFPATAFGVEITGAIGTVTNAGTISETGPTGGGVYLAAGGTVSNVAGGLITSNTVGVDVLGLATVVNAGTITGSGGTAVSFGAAGSRLVVDPGAMFHGIAAATGVGNTLELGSSASVGTLTGLGSSFTNFTSVALDAKAIWNLSGAVNSLAGGATLALGNGGTIRVTGSLDVAGGLSLTGAGSISLAPIGPGGTPGKLEIGTGGASKAGYVTIDPNATLTGSGTIRASVSVAGNLTASGSMRIQGPLSGGGSVAVVAGGVLTVSGSVSSRTMTFLNGTRSKETFAFGAPTEVTATLQRFGQVGNTVDLLGLVANASSFSAGVLTVSSAGGATAKLNFAGSYTTGNFLLGSDGHGGTNITFKA